MSGQAAWMSQGRQPAASLRRELACLGTNRGFYIATPCISADVAKAMDKSLSTGKVCNLFCTAANLGVTTSIRRTHR